MPKITLDLGVVTIASTGAARPLEKITRITMLLWISTASAGFGTRGTPYLPFLYLCGMQWCH
jgi:hypothetical protein